MPEETLENPEGADKTAGFVPVADADVKLEGAIGKIDGGLHDVSPDTQALNELAEVAKTDAAAAAAWNELVAQAKPILLRDFNGKVCLESGWPEVVAIAPVLLEQKDLFAVDDATGAITVTLGNARAVYRYAGMDANTTIARLTEDYTAPPAEEPLVETPADPVVLETEDVSEMADDVLGSIPADKVHVDQVELVDGGPAQAMLIEPHGGKGWQIAVAVIRGGEKYGHMVAVSGGLRGFNDPQVLALKEHFIATVEAKLARETTTLPASEGGQPAPIAKDFGEITLSAEALAVEKRVGVTEEPPAADPNVKCPVCKMYGNRHKRGCSKA